MSLSEDNYNLKEYLQNMINDNLDAFNVLLEWTDEERKEFALLLDGIKHPKLGESTKEIGDRLEKLVSFIIDKSYFYKVYKNVRTQTNEIDEIVVFSDKGRQALHKFNLSRDLIPISSNIFLGECKNYGKSLGVTYVGKFYSLLTATGNSFGIMFTKNGLTGQEQGYKDAYGLTKVIRMIEQYKNNNDFYILSFKLEDYEKLLEGHTFFEIVAAKKIALQHASDYLSLLAKNKHLNESSVQEVLDEIPLNKRG